MHKVKCSTYAINWYLGFVQSAKTQSSWAALYMTQYQNNACQGEGGTFSSNGEDNVQYM